MTFFCVDIGTTTMKAAAVSDQGAVLFLTAKRLAAFTAVDAAGKWVLALSECCREYAISPQFVPPDSLTVSGNGPTLVAVDRFGKVLMTYLWNTPSQYLASDTAKHDLQNCNSLFIPRLVSFLHEFPEVYGSAANIISGPEYLAYVLTGTLGTSLPEARYRDAYWNGDICRRFAVDAQKLPPFYPAGTFAGTLTAESAGLIGFLQGTPVLWGLPDFLAALAGTGAVIPGVLCDRAGTSEGLNLCIGYQPQNAGMRLRVLPSLVPGLWNISYLIPDSGKRFADFMMTPAASAAGWLSVISRIELSYRKPQLLDDPVVAQGRRLLESLATEISAGLEQLEAATAISVTELRMCGGQAKNESWCRLKARLTGIPVVVPQCPDAELMGSAVLASVHEQCYADIQNAVVAMIHTGQRYAPYN